MHELGTVFYVIQEVEKAAEETPRPRAAGVTRGVGGAGGTTPFSLPAWGRGGGKKPQYLRGGELKTEPPPAVTYCEDCKQTYPTVKYAKICPHCKSEHTYLLSGNEYTIKEIEAC